MRNKDNTQSQLRPARHIRQQRVKSSPAKPTRLTKKQLAELAELAAQQDAENAADLQKASQNMASTGGIDPYSQSPMNSLSLEQVEQYAKAWAWERYDNHRGDPKAADAFMRTLRYEITETDPKWRKWLETTKSTIVKLRLNPDISAAALGVSELVREYERVRKAEHATVRMTEDGDQEAAQGIRAVSPKLGAARRAAEDMAAVLQSDAKHGKGVKLGRSKAGENNKAAAASRAKEIRSVYDDFKADEPGHKREQYIAATKEHFLKLHNRKKPRLGYGETTIAKVTQGQ